MSDLVPLRKDPQYKLVAAVYPMGLDVKAKPFDSKEVRRAVGFAIDRERIVRQVPSPKAIYEIVQHNLREIGAGNPSHMDAKRYNELREAVQSADDRTRPKALRELTSYLLDEGFSHVTAVALQYFASRSSVVGLRSASWARWS